MRFLSLISLLRLGILAICLWAVFSGNYPPAAAQSPRSSEDTQQDDRLSNLETDQKDLRSNIEKTIDKINEIKNADSENQGLVKGFGFVLTLMVGGSLTLQIRKKP